MGLNKSTSDHAGPADKDLNLRDNQKQHFKTKITFGYTSFWNYLVFLLLFWETFTKEIVHVVGTCNFYFSEHIKS